MPLFGFGGPLAEISYNIDDLDTHPLVNPSPAKPENLLPMFSNGDAISGSVTIKSLKQKLEHTGIRLELIGQIELLYDKNNPHRFLSLKTELAPPGILPKMNSFKFDFPSIDLRHDTYYGRSCRLRYFIRTTIVRNYSNIQKEFDFCVWNKQIAPKTLKPIKMEVGIESCLHIEFYYERTHFNLHDTLLGKIYFLLVRIKIKHMECSIIRRETTGIAPNVYHDSFTVVRYQIMDGCPVEDECVPVRIHLGGYNIAPTYSDVHNRFSVKYFLNLVLVDTDDRRYFKQSEITLYRNRLPKYGEGAATRKRDPNNIDQQAREMMAPHTATARVVSKNTSTANSKTNK